MYGNGLSTVCTKQGTSKISQLLQELDDSDDEQTANTEQSTPESSAQPWKKDFIHWMKHDEWFEEGMDVVTWWGMSKIFLLFSINVIKTSL